MDVRKKVKDNVENIQSMYREVINWEKEMKRKENCLLQSKVVHNEKEVPPVRTKLRKENTDLSNEKIVNAFNKNTIDKEKREESLFEKELGNEFVKQQKWLEAIPHYTNAINCFSKDATFYCNRAYCFLQTAKYKEAETDCTTALQIDPQYVKAYHRRALALKELNQLKEAHENLIKALELEPNNTRIKQDKFKLEKVMTDRVSSKMTLETKSEAIKESNKNLAYVKKEKGNIYVKKKEWAVAIEYYTEACKLYPDDPSFYLNRALCFLKTNEPRKTILDCIRVLELDSNNIKAYYRRALANESLGNYSKAHDDFLMAFKLDPTDQIIQENLIKIEKNLGILPEENVNKKSLSNNTSANLNTFNKRITGEKFLAVGGYFVEPLKKSAHQLSKKPLQTIKISDKNENTLKSALEELNVSDKKSGSTKENADPNKSFVKSVQMNFSESSSIDENYIEIDVDSLLPPKTSMQFVSTWNKLTNSKMRYQYLKKIDGKNFPSIFKEALESYIFSEILEILSSEFIKAGESVYKYLYGFSKVKRISALLLFATEEDNAYIKTLFNYMNHSNDIPQNELASLRSFYLP